MKHKNTTITFHQHRHKKIVHKKILRSKRSNHSPFINKTILKAIMNQSQLKNKFLKTRSNEDKKAYNTQRNYCLTLVTKAKKDYYNNLDHENVTDNKTFWKSIKPLFSEKSSTHNKIIGRARPNF